VNLPFAAFDQFKEWTNWIEEVAMAALIKKTGSRIARWIKQFREKNRPPYRWYEHDSGMG
jgi:hypothetical protein